MRKIAFLGTAKILKPLWVKRGALQELLVACCRLVSTKSFTDRYPDTEELTHAIKTRT